MTAITYTAKDRNIGGRSALVSGHSVDTEYSLETDAPQLDVDYPPERTEHVSLGGQYAGTLHRIDEVWSVTTDHIEEADVANWKEWVASVSAMESFTFDPYGTIATPDAPVTAVLSGKPQLNRIQTLKVYQYQFKVIVIGDAS